jgi:hypothetical protein
VLALTGCNAGRAFYASSSDYGDYRALRVAEGADARMAAAWHYLKEHPDGAYAERVRRYFDKAEPVYYKARRDSRGGLERYLRSLPDGPHAKEAYESLGLLRRTAARRRELERERTSATVARIEAEEALRREAAALLFEWVGVLLDERTWRGTLSDAPDALLVPWNVSLPPPECGPWEEGGYLCRKPVERGYRIVVAGEKVPRAVAFEIELELDAGWRLRRATLRGASLLVRALEASEQRALDDAAERSRAAAHFEQEVTKLTFARELLCNGGSDERGRLELACETLSLRMTPGGDGDEIVVERSVEPQREPAPEPPPPPQG